MGNPEDNTIPNDNTASYGTSTSPQSGGQPLVSAQPAPQPAPEVPSSTNGAASPITQPTRPSKKTVWTIVAIVATLLLVAGAITWFVLANQKHDDQAGTNNSSTSGTDGNGTNDNNSSNNDGSDAKPKPDPIPTTPNNNQLTELSLDDATVQKVYGWFGSLSSTWWGEANFYAEEDTRLGNPSKNRMLLVALYNTEKTKCRTSHWSVLGYDAAAEGCYQGADIKNSIKEIFNKTITLNNGDKIGGGCAWVYDADNDEFYSEGAACGGMSPTVLRKLYRAEKDESHIYLYEVLAVNMCGENWVNFCRIGDDGDGNLFGGEVIEFLGNSNTMDAETVKSEMLKHKDELDKFKWTFKRSGEDYIFEKVEKI